MMIGQTDFGARSYGLVTKKLRRYDWTQYPELGFVVHEVCGTLNFVMNGQTATVARNSGLVTVKLWQLGTIETLSTLKTLFF